MATDETKIAVLEEKVQNLSDKMDHVQDGIDIINTKLDDKYATKEELQSLREDHIFWRNVLVALVSSTLLLSIGLLIQVISTK